MNDEKIKILFISLTLLMLISCLMTGRGAMTLEGAHLLRTDPASNWQLDETWRINRTEEGYGLINTGQGEAIYAKPCGEGPLKFSFMLKRLDGTLNANININGSNRYIISIRNNGNGTLSTYLIRSTGASRSLEASRAGYSQIRGQNLIYESGGDQLITITFNEGRILVTSEIIDLAPQTAINYIDENPLPSGSVGFENPGGIEFSQIEINDIVVSCPSQNMHQPELGIGYFKRPTTDVLISSPWGIVPANQVMVVVENASNFSDAQRIAQSLAADLDGQVVGEFEIINLFQIETSTEEIDGLMNDLAFSKGNPSISLAFPNEEIALEEDPLDDLVYSEGRSGGYELVGAKGAWEMISGHGLCDVRVGVTDNGLYKGYDEFSGIVSINTTAEFSELIDRGNDYPRVGSHGTGVMNILAADPDNGGIVGIASQALREHLSVTMINIFPDGHGYVSDSLLGLKNEIEGGCTILSCSWGDSNGNEDTVMAFTGFFNDMFALYPCLLFVCSAGNDGKGLDGRKRIPNGMAVSNLITVGNVLNNGRKVDSSNTNNPQGGYEVTLAAPGENAVWGWDRKFITRSLGGTSMATPHVTASAAIIRSLNPELSAEMIKEILRSGSKMKSDDIGGVLDIPAALNQALSAECMDVCINCTVLISEDIGEYHVDGIVNIETEEFGIVEGRLYNLITNASIASAEIIVRTMPDEKIFKRGIRTDSLGYYRFELPPGQYQLDGLAAGYGVIPHAVDVYSGQTTKRDLRARKGI